MKEAEFLVDEVTLHSQMII